MKKQAELELEQGHTTDKTSPLVKEQRLVIQAIRGIEAGIVKQFDPDEFEFIGVGRSPTPIMALLEKRDEASVQWFPLSDFRPQNPRWTVRTEAFGGGAASAAAEHRPQKLTARQQERLFEHFDRHLVKPKRDKVLVIDYAITGKTLLAAQEQLEQYFAARKIETEIHAYAFCRSGGDFFNVGDLVKAVGPKPWSLWDRWGNRAAQRESFAERWHTLPIGEATGDDKGRALAGLAFRRSAFDGLAPHGEYRALDVPDKGPLPVAIPERSQPTAKDGYHALQEALHDGQVCNPRI